MPVRLPPPWGPTPSPCLEVTFLAIYKLRLDYNGDAIDLIRITFKFGPKIAICIILIITNLRSKIRVANFMRTLERPSKDYWQILVNDKIFANWAVIDYYRCRKAAATLFTDAFAERPRQLPRLEDDDGCLLVQAIFTKAEVLYKVTRKLLLQVVSSSIMSKVILVTGRSTYHSYIVYA